jgi:aryl-alcohol dehydrogenase-like predicted oxidoreductase
LIRLALGTVQFGLPYGIANQLGQVSRAEAKAMLQIASARGVDTLDTAIAYGESEACLGEVGVDDFKVVTKLPSIPKGCLDLSEWVKQQVESSLSRLGVSNVYGLLLHCSGDLLGPNGRSLYQALESLKDKGLVKKIGISIYSPDELELLTTNFHFDLVQAPFNLLDRRLLSSGWMQKLKDGGVEIHTRSAFLQGLLLINRSDIPPKFLPWNGILKMWHDWLEDNNVSALQASLAFPLSLTQIDRVVVGADSTSQLAQILSAANKLLQADLPDIYCDDENLINPANWNRL